MTVPQGLQAALTSRFGLLPRSGWDSEIPRLLHRLSRRYGMSREAFVARAMIDEFMLREIAAGLTVDESFFFRHPEQISFLVERTVESLRKGVYAPLVWSAGCSRGQEPYSLAIALAEVSAECRILASDINDAAVAEARRGVYTCWAARGLNEERTHRFFEHNGNDSLRVRRDIRESVQFDCLPLAAHLEQMTPLSVDHILFRNVAIYLTPDARREIYLGFRRCLKANGILFISPSDPAPPRDVFQRLHDGPGGGFRPLRESLGQKAARVMMRNVQVANDPPREYRIAPPDENEVLRRASKLANEGLLEEALCLLDPLLAKENGRAAALLLRGQINLSRGTLEQAVEDLRRAVFIEPSPIARFWYANALRQSGAFKRALMQLKAMENQIVEARVQQNGGEEDSLLTAARELKEQME